MFGAGTRTAVAAVAVGLAVATAAPASAASVGPPITSGLVGPLGLALGPGGERDIYVSQAFAGLLTRVKGGEATVVHAEAGASVEGLAVDRDGSVVFTTSTGEMAPTAGLLKRRAPGGAVSTIGDPFAYEVDRNPDGRRQYGFRDLPASCREQLPEELGPPTYDGIVESHPYAVAVLADGSYAVADAGGNTIVRVTRRGVVSTIAVLPPQPVVVTADAAAATGLPDCAVGSTYAFEAVPTDVEVGPDGQLYVTTLPGGPEDPSLGARGSVYRVNPDTGRTRRIATGFNAPTGLAVSPQGRVYVAELFGGRISRVVDGAPRTVVEVGLPAALEYHRGSLYATVDALPPEQGPPDGKVVRIRL